MSKDYGFTFNVSAVNNPDGTVNCGVNFRDTDGRKFNREYRDMRDYAVMSNVLSKDMSEHLFKMMMEPVMSDEEKARLARKAELEEKIAEVEGQLDALEEEYADIVGDYDDDVDDCDGNCDDCEFAVDDDDDEPVDEHQAKIDAIVSELLSAFGR